MLRNAFFNNSIQTSLYFKSETLYLSVLKAFAAKPFYSISERILLYTILYEFYYITRIIISIIVNRFVYDLHLFRLSLYTTQCVPSIYKFDLCNGLYVESETFFIELFPFFYRHFPRAFKYRLSTV